ncbi:sugar transferase [uncultured Tenacibaculum sp.]|uniref:sugar transferase n=1 Tax=uncultured Tenacibaculum sp. TaxID=174713 RepID=UPI00261A46C2|nr:sugar transferase [uncultured Tenacibaculum sp.]
MYNKIFKRVIDFIFATLGLFLTFPLLVLVSIGLTIVNKGKPFFFQSRPGKDEKLFYIIKFKTMNDKKDSKGNLLPDSKRISKIGRIVRKSSLDELPQLINVLKGDMSIIGPRPLLPEYLLYYNQEQKKRHDVRPGISGWAQVNGRNAISWTSKFQLDIYYVNNISFYLDLEIFFKSFKKVIKSEGISAENHATIEKFNGKN